MANNEMFTPSDLLESCRKVFGNIDLDPASCYHANKTVKAHTFYDQHQNGLILEWFGNVWCNPPYSRGMMAPFTDRMISRFRWHLIDNGMLLCNAQTAAKWYHRALRACTYKLEFDYRISFIDGATMEVKRGNDRSQVLFYFGGHAGRFVEEFSKYGTIVKVVK